MNINILQSSISSAEKKCVEKEGGYEGCGRGQGRGQGRDGLSPFLHNEFFGSNYHDIVLHY